MQCVLTKNQRHEIVKWMIEEAENNGETRIASRVIKQFPMLFRSNPNENLLRASRYWRNGEKLILDKKKTGKRDNGLFNVVATRNGLKVRVSKTNTGRGRRVTPWVKRLYEELVEEFDRLRKLSVNFNCDVLRQLALHIIQDGLDNVVNRHSKDPKSGRLISSHVTRS